MNWVTYVVGIPTALAALLTVINVVMASKKPSLPTAANSNDQPRRSPTVNGHQRFRRDI